MSKCHVIGYVLISDHFDDQNFFYKVFFRLLIRFCLFFGEVVFSVTIYRRAAFRSDEYGSDVKINVSHFFRFGAEKKQFLLSD